MNTTTNEPLRVISYGGGVQSTALCVLAAQGKLDEIMGGPMDAALFSNVGDDSEHPATLTYVRDVMMPWAAERGLPIIETEKRNRQGEVVTIRGRIMREDLVSTDIPVHMPSGRPGDRTCTRDFKIHVIGKWLKARGAGPDNRAVVAIGISTDEFHRANRKKAEAYEDPRFPLLELGLNRTNCVEIIKAAGLPIPRKSSCFFCPFKRPSQWAEMRRDEPELFAQAQEVEDAILARMARLERPPVYLTRYGKRISEAIATAQPSLFEEDAFNNGQCDEGYCWT